MKLLIIEDETTAFVALKEQLAELMPNAIIEGPIQSIDEAIEYFETNEMPNLVFMDIHLADGSAFAIFNSVDIICPIIFTTAYDQYALKAFSVNSIDYLLKPIDTNQLHRALDKFQNFAKNNINNEQIQKLISSFKPEPTYKKCLLVPQRDKLVLVESERIAFIYIDTQVIKMITTNGDIYFPNDTLEDIYQQLDPKQFYRANRQQIINRSIIKDISTWIGNKVLVTPKISIPERITISKGRAAEFKKWLANN
ncbi:MAG: response regulator transcription factor [Paludibacteraceae bacterium]|nr:response regulator transcription factor [Paludibacteraceae bacterium]